jgi:hypothetical protein
VVGRREVGGGRFRIGRRGEEGGGRKEKFFGREFWGGEDPKKKTHAGRGREDVHP